MQALQSMADAGHLIVCGGQSAKEAHRAPTSSQARAPVPTPVSPGLWTMTVITTGE
jgi:hypothetical protein